MPVVYATVHTYLVLTLDLAGRAHGRMRGLARSERGEGVISTALAVLIMAIIGAAMWVAFDGIWESTERQTTDKVNEIGS